MLKRRNISLPTSRRGRTALLALAAAGLLTGCTVGPKYHRPSASVPTAPSYKESSVNFQDADGWKVAAPQDAMLHGKWWEIFQDPELNALEEQVEVNNQNVRLAYENYMQARAIVAEARSQYWPTVSIGPSWSRSKSSGNLKNAGSASAGSGAGGTITNSGSQSTVWSFPVDVSWVPDLWGRIRNQVRAAEYSAQVSAADLESAKLSAQGQLAQTYFELRGQDALAKILNETVEADKKALELTQTLYDTGVSDQIAVVEARTTLQNAEAAAYGVGVARAQYEHAIAVLIGKPATEFSASIKPLLLAPPPIPVGVPSQLLERRPDVAAAERTLASANATIGIGYGAFFPNITLSATGGFEASEIKHWFDWPSRFWSVGPSVSQTVFNGGLYRAQLHEYSAIYNADVAGYRQTVLTAFQQVEDYLASVRIYSQQIQKQREALGSAQEFLRLQTGRYETGIDPYINVVTAQNTVLGDQQQLATLQIQQMAAAVQLIVALGGGWDASQLPTPSDMAKRVPAGEYKMKQ